MVRGRGIYYFFGNVNNKIKIFKNEYDAFWHATLHTKTSFELKFLVCLVSDDKIIKSKTKRATLTLFVLKVGKLSIEIFLSWNKARSMNSQGCDL